MMIVWIPLAVMLIGAVMYFVAANPKVAEVARLALFVGLFFTVWWVSNIHLTLAHEGETTTRSR